MFRKISKEYQLWKWSVFAFTQTLPMEFIITISYWSLLYPQDEHDSKTAYDKFKFSTEHTVPFFFLLIDYCINAILFQPWHWILSFWIAIAYMIVNLSVTLATGEPVYSVITWKDAKTAVLVPLLLVSYLASYLIFAYISKLKLNKFTIGAQNKLRLS